MDDFGFDIADIVILLNLTIRHKSAISIDTNCPFCGNVKGKMNINLKKQVYRCNRCGENGGKLDLFGKLHGIDNKEAYQQITEALQTGRKHFHYKEKKEKLKVLDIKQADPIQEAKKHNTYKKLFSILHLTDTHKKKLLERGLSEEAIQTNGYKSVPVFGYRNIVRILLELGCQLEGVPGFYQEDGEWRINFSPKSSGILIPVRTLEGNLAAAQIRLDRPYNKRKYFWLSSVNFEMGASPGSPIHFVGNPHDTVVYVTEGPLKGDLAHHFSGHSFACVPGVNQYKNLNALFVSLKKNGTELIWETFDMDKLTNKNVEKGTKKFFQIAKDFDMPAKQLLWNSKWKGIDDYLFSNYRSNI